MAVTALGPVILILFALLGPFMGVAALLLLFVGVRG